MECWCQPGKLLATWGKDLQHVDGKQQGPRYNNTSHDLKLTNICDVATVLSDNLQVDSITEPSIIQDVEAKLVGPSNLATVTIENVECQALVDTGSVVSSISEGFYRKYLNYIHMYDINEIFNGRFTLNGANGQKINIAGYIKVDILLPGLKEKIPILMTVFQQSALDEEVPILIGTNVMDEWKHHLQRQHGGFHKIPAINYAIDTWRTESTTVGIMKNIEATTIKPGMETKYIKSIFYITHAKPYDRNVLFSPREQYEYGQRLEMEPTLIRIPANRRNLQVDIPVHNYSTHTYTVRAKEHIGKVESISRTNPMVDNGDEQYKDFMQAFNMEQHDVTEEEQEKIKQLLWSFQDIFALNSHELGCCDLEQHVIELDDMTPIKERYRRIAPEMYEAVRAEIQRMLEDGVIQHSYSPWSSPITIVVKKDGSPRVCVDYRKINARTKKDAKSIPRIDETLDALRGAKVFSSLDLMSGYWQTAMEDRSRELTAFTAGPLGFYEFNRMPFGLTNAGATFQRMMEQVLRPLLNRDCLVYIDDIIIFSTDIESHICKLSRVFQQLRAHGLRLKPKKCTFMMKEISFLGHRVSEQGITKDPSKVQTIVD